MQPYISAHGFIDRIGLLSRHATPRRDCRGMLILKAYIGKYTGQDSLCL